MVGRFLKYTKHHLISELCYKNLQTNLNVNKLWVPEANGLFGGPTFGSHSKVSKLSQYPARRKMPSVPLIFKYAHFPG